MRNYFANWPSLMKLIWRRDRVRLTLWILSLVGLSLAVAASFPALFPPGPQRRALASTLQNPALIAMIGPAYGGADYHLGAVMAHQMLLFTASAAGIMNILLAVRHTRRDEELGRLEAVRAWPVGKLAHAGATLFVSALANAALALLTAGGLGVLFLEGMDWAGSLLYGSVLGVTGFFFAAAAVFLAQLTETSRGAAGLSFALLGLSYLGRALGDLDCEALSLSSPLGLILRSQVYVNNYWWPVSLLFFFGCLLAGAALALQGRRDLGAGLIPAQKGKSRGRPLLLSPFGLALRLQKTTTLGWAAGLFVLGAAYGSVFADLDAFFRTSEILGMLLPQAAGFSLTQQFAATLLAVLAVMGAIPVLLAILKLKAEEEEGRLEPLLAQPLSRGKLMGVYLLLAVFTAVLTQFFAVLGLWLGARAVLDEPLSFTWFLKGAGAYLPPLGIMLGLTAFLVGCFPRLAPLIWPYLGCTFFVTYFGELLQIPPWLRRLTPFGFVPPVPLEPLGLGRTFLLVLTAVFFTTGGLSGYQRRDLA